MKIQLITVFAALWRCHIASADGPTDPDIALKPAHVIVNPWRFHIPSTKRQGVGADIFLGKSRQQHFAEATSEISVQQANPSKWSSIRRVYLTLQCQDLATETEHDVGIWVPVLTAFGFETGMFGSQMAIVAVQRLCWIQ